MERPRNNKLSYTVAACWSFSYTLSLIANQPAATYVCNTRSCNTVYMPLMMSENIARNMWSGQGIISYPTQLQLVGHFRISFAWSPRHEGLRGAGGGDSSIQILACVIFLWRHWKMCWWVIHAFYLDIPLLWSITSAVKAYSGCGDGDPRILNHVTNKLSTLRWSYVTPEEKQLLGNFCRWFRVDFIGIR